MKVRVLLIDKEDEARTALAERLGRLRGLDLVGAARNEQEVAQTLTNAQPDILLVDLHSGDLDGDGVRLCSELRKLASVPLVVLTSFMTNERWQRLRAAGVTQCLLKQVDSERLERELVRAGTAHGSDRAADAGKDP
jgi:two-component system response regulator (stage 0 sporulation protein A)